MARKGKENLRTPTSEEARAIGKKGGEASARSRREKKNAMETAQMFLDMAAAGNLDDILEKLNIPESNRTNLMGIVARHVVSAQSGNVNSARLVLEMAGMLQKGAENNVNINMLNEEDKVVFYIPENGRD